MIKDTTKRPHPEWLFGGNPGAIEAQEEEGQMQLCQSKDLPRKCLSSESYDAIPVYKKLGIKIVKDGLDELFVSVQLPKDWKVIATNHSMWSNLVDDKGRIRANIFYKAAFYDRSAHISFKRRYNIELINFLENKQVKYEDYHEEKNNTPIFGKVLDCGTTIFETKHDFFTKKYEEKHSKKWWEELKEVERSKVIECTNFLDKKYPQWRDIFAYW